MQTTIHSAIVTHDNGTNLYLGSTRASVDKQVADYCRDWWPSEFSGDDAPELPDAEIIEAYFNRENMEETADFDDYTVVLDDPQPALRAKLEEIRDAAPFPDNMEPDALVSHVESMQTLAREALGMLEAGMEPGQAGSTDQRRIARTWTDRELATVLYALRHVQEQLASAHGRLFFERMAGSEHFEDEGCLPLTVAELDEFCELLNLDGVAILEGGK